MLPLALLLVAQQSSAPTPFQSCLAAIGNCSASCGCVFEPVTASYCACSRDCSLGCAGLTNQDGSCCGCTQSAVASCHRLHDCDGDPCGSGGKCSPSASCALTTRPAPSCAAPSPGYVQWHSCSWVPPGTPGPKAMCQPDSCGDVINCSACEVGPTGHRPTPSEVEAAVRPVLDRAAAYFNTSFSFGWADGRANASAGVVAGRTLNSSCSHKPCDRSLVPVGSTTKVFTSVAVLQLVERGLLSLDTPAHTLIDPVLKPQCGFTMAEHWPNSTAAIQLVTVRHLLSMTSGSELQQKCQLSFGIFECKCRDGGDLP